MVDGAVAEHFEVLGLAFGGGVGLVEGVGHADAFDGFLGDAVDAGGGGDACGLEDGGHDVDDVVELGADGALVLDAVGP